MPHRLACLILGIALGLPAATRAELPAPRFTYLAPLGVSAGGEVEVNVRGGEFETVDALVFDHPGLKAELLKPAWFRVSVAADVPEGTYDVWASGRFGLSNPRLLAVSHGLEDRAEAEPNDGPAQAQQIEPNVAINGFSDENGDCFRFHVPKGAHLSIDCLAQRLLTVGDRTIPPAEMSLTLLAAEGTLVARSSRYYGNDPFLDHVFEAEGWYLLELEESNYTAGQPYRLVISDRPHLENVSPRAVEPGKPTELVVYGRNLGPGSQPSAWRVDGRPLEERRTTVTLPADPAGLFQFQFSEHPTGLAFPVTCSTVMLHGAQLRPDWGGGSLNTVSLLHAWTAPTVESEPNDTPEQAQRLSPQALVDGRFDPRADVDCYRVEIPPGQGGSYAIQVYCERLGCLGDPAVRVDDEQGRSVAELDDFNFGSFVDGRNRDPFGLVDLQEKRTYRLMVKDLHGRGGARFQYVLSLSRAEPDFDVMAFAPLITLGGVGNCRGTTIRKGGAEFVQVLAVHEGLPCPIEVVAVDLPAGLHAAPCHLPPAKNARGAVVLWADADAPEWTGPIHLTATAHVDGKTIERPVIPCTSSTPTTGGRPTRSLMAAIRHSSPFFLGATPETIRVRAGGQAELRVVATRHWPESKGRIEVQNAINFSTLNVTIPNRSIAAEESETTFVLQVPAKTAPGEYTLCFQGVSAVPFRRNAEGTGPVEETTVFQPSTPVTVIVEPLPR